MPDNTLGNWIVALFWIECAIFGLGSTAGLFLPLVARAFGLDENRAKDWAMRLALALAFFGGLIAVGATGGYLATYVGTVSDRNCKIAATVWSGIEIIGSSAFPRLELTLYVDALSALFGLLIGFFTACVAWYSFGWLDQNARRHSVAGAFGLFAFSTLLVVLVNNGFWLLLVLEFMSLSFGYLVLYRGQQGGSQEESKIAIRTYLIVSHVSTICLAIAILIIGVGQKSLDFELFRQPKNALPLLSRDVAFLFALVGLGMRAGMTPFHFWVPVVHPQSPTTTHAFSLGVAIKVAVYLMIRFFFEFLLPISWWWGVLLLILAGLTAVLNVFYALLSRDLKRALAYHSVENIGIILVGLGLALLFGSERFGNEVTVQSVAGVALIASLFHTFNHAIFKGLLYLGTGCIENRTHTVIMDELGGLIRRYRWTSVLFLVGAIAIAGFPPFNGFISEWLTLQSFFAGI
ncbi:MAG: proton-conducting transporter membrane subunit, partial [Chloroflexota bacterium]